MPTTEEYQLRQLLQQQAQRPSGVGSDLMSTLGYALGGGFKQEAARRSKIDELFQVMREKELQRKAQEIEQEQYERGMEKAAYQERYLQNIGGAVNNFKEYGEMIGGTGAYTSPQDTAIPNIVLPTSQGGFEEIPRQPKYVPFSYPTQREKASREIQTAGDTARAEETAKADAKRVEEKRAEAEGLARLTEAVESKNPITLNKEELALYKYVQEQKDKKKMLSTIRDILATGADPKDKKQRAELFTFAIEHEIKDPVKLIKTLYGGDYGDKKVSKLTLLKTAQSLAKDFGVSLAEGRLHARHYISGEPLPEGTPPLKKRKPVKEKFTSYQQHQMKKNVEAIIRDVGIGGGLSEEEIENLNSKLRPYGLKAKMEELTGGGQFIDPFATHKFLGVESAGAEDESYAEPSASSSGESLRQQAIDILKRNDLAVDEKQIAAVMKKIKEKQ